MMQKTFLLKLKSALPADISAIKWLADLLDINETSASRKLKGEIVLKLTELELILEAYPTLIDALIPKSVASNTLVGQYVSFTNEQDIERYLLKVKSIFEEAVANNYTLNYFARDLPLLLFFADPLVFNYKVAMWCNNVSEEKLERTNHKLWTLAHEVFELYQNTATEEIWYKNLLNNQIFQLEYYNSFGKISNKQKAELLNAFRIIFKRVNNWALKGNKENGPYHLSVSDYALLNNGGLFIQENTPLMLMTSLSSVFFLSTSHQETLNRYLAEYNFHKQRSTSITKVNERERSTFFYGLEKILTL